MFPEETNALFFIDQRRRRTDEGKLRKGFYVHEVMSFSLTSLVHEAGGVNKKNEKFERGEERKWRKGKMKTVGPIKGERRNRKRN